MTMITDEKIAVAVRPLYGSDEAARMGLADDLKTARAVEAVLLDEIEALRAAVRKMHAAKGRHHNQLATCDLYDLVGLPNVRPGEAAPEPVEPVAWRTRYRSDPGETWSYPWTYSERSRRLPQDPRYEWEPLYAAPTTEAGGRE